MEGQKIPILTPIDPDEFWMKIRELIRAEMERALSKEMPVSYDVPGMKQKPLYKASEIAKLFSVSRQTIHQWSKEALLRPYKVKSRLFFLASDIDCLLEKLKS